MPTFIDMFAGAGGFSEGFLQAEAAKSILTFFWPAISTRPVKLPIE